MEREKIKRKGEQAKCDQKSIVDTTRSNHYCIVREIERENKRGREKKGGKE